MFEGKLLHNDSHGIHGTVNPGEVNLMTAGGWYLPFGGFYGRRHCFSWGAAVGCVSESARRGQRRFDHYVPESITFPGGSALVFIGSLLGSTSPVPTFTLLVSAQILLQSGAELDIPVRADFEHGTSLMPALLLRKMRWFSTGNWLMHVPVLPFYDCEILVTRRRGLSFLVVPRLLNH